MNLHEKGCGAMKENDSLVVYKYMKRIGCAGKYACLFFLVKNIMLVNIIFASNRMYSQV